ncbi:hypothetical protein AN641_04890 [Candidatus Epulonipiscioides gigas]|nr:hypothetical protein AN641_04875 [Epulopiscium sp. SCG-C07WGA-EpuloA2]ONI45084.1 hypothetical protein AN641_04890 [Epulopiscium sp. SCG-C07WGA-EpuloA2]
MGPTNQGANWGRARAPPVSGRRWGPYPRPNQPVPPLGGSRYFGPQSRSYASVVRQPTITGNPRTTNAGPQGPRGNQGQQQNQPTDPKFGKLVRKLHSIIKTVHHLQNVAHKPGKPQPVMISRMVETLSAMIKPALPTSKTMDLITGNAKNWGYTTLMILEDHYTGGLETLLNELKEDWVANWQPAFEVATKWARRNLPRITQDVIEHAEALITACQEIQEDQAPTPQPIPQPQFRDQAQQTQTQQTQTHQTQARSTPQSTKQNVATMTDQEREMDNLPDSGEEEIQDGEQISESPVPITPQERRPIRRARATPGVVPEDSFDFGIEEIGEDGSQSRSVRRGVVSVAQGPLDNDDSSLDNTPTLKPIQTHGTSKMGIQVEAMVHQESIQPEDTLGSSLDDLFDFTSTPKTQTFKVKRHINTDKKMLEWGLSVGKKWLIIGDSNISRIGTHSIPDLQIESYPGANFRHASSIIAKATSHLTVEKVVLSFGLNCRGQKARETSIRQMQAAIRTAKKKFPYSELWIPVINYSTLLTAAEQITLQTINAHITRNLPFIPMLPHTEFKTEKDHLHWTKETARAMLNHWISYLNFKAP